MGRSGIDAPKPPADAPPALPLTSLPPALRPTQVLANALQRSPGVQQLLARHRSRSLSSYHRRPLEGGGEAQASLLLARHPKPTAAACRSSPACPPLPSSPHFSPHSPPAVSDFLCTPTPTTSPCFFPFTGVDWRRQNSILGFSAAAQPSIYPGAGGPPQLHHWIKHLLQQPHDLFCPAEVPEELQPP